MKKREKRGRHGRRAMFTAVCLALALATIAAGATQASGWRGRRSLQEQAPPPLPTRLPPPPPAPPVPPEWAQGSIIHGRWNATLNRWEYTGRNAMPLGSVRWNPTLKNWEYTQPPEMDKR